MPTPNGKFREARERTPSPDHPTECLTRQELAEKANTWLWEHHNKEFVLTGGYIAKLEQGIIRWPTALYREAFRVILDASTDSALGFVNTKSRRGAVKLNNVKRKQFIIKTVTSGVGAFALGESLRALLEDGEPTPIPTRVGAPEIEQVRTATREFKSWGATYGGGLVREPLMAQLRWSAGLLDAICPDELRPELFSAVGDLASAAGYLSEDINAQEDARRAYRFALACAEEAKDWSLRAETLSSMTRQAIRAGQPDEGLTLAELALIRPERLSPAGRACLHADRGEALAKMRRVQEALSAIGTADEHFAHVTPDSEPPIMAYYTNTCQALITGYDLVDLAILGRDPSEATTRLQAAAAGHTADHVHVRSRAVCLANLASLTMVTGDPLQAVTIGNEALEVAGSIRSRRATEELRELSRYAAAHQDLEEVADLRQRIGALVPTNSP